MPDGNEIRANAADGTVHVFPGGTDPSVVDRVMKQYAMGQQSPSREGALPTGSYQTRKGGPVLNTQESPIHSAASAAQGALGIHDADTLGDAFKQAGTSFKNFLGSSYHELDPISWGSPQYGPGVQAALTVPHTIARGIEGLATGVEGASSDIETGVKNRDPRSVAAGVGSLASLRGMFADPEFRDFAKNVSESGRLLKQADAINKGQVQVINEHVRKPLAMLDTKVNQEIGAHAKAAIDADQAHMAATGSTKGLVNATKAAEAANSKTATLGITLPAHIDDMIARASNPMTLNEAKQLTTDVGRTAAALTRQGNYRPAAVMNELYSGLHEATQDRADDLGMGKSWKQYIDVNRSYKNLQEGLLGELVDEPNHAKAMNKLIDPTRATEWNELRDELKNRGIDPSSFEKARDYAKDMSGLISTTGNLFFNKIKAMIQHPFTAGPVAIGAAQAGHLSGIPGLGFVLPIIAAGKTAGLLDTAKLNGILAEINKIVPPEAGRTRPALPTPMQPQSGLASKYGLIERPASAPGLKSFQDSTTGGSIEMKEGFTEQQLANKVNAHRAAMKATPAEGKSDLAAKKADIASGRMGEQYEKDIQSALMDQFKFTANAAKNVTDSIKGKYSSFDDGLRMAIAEAVRRSKNR